MRSFLSILLFLFLSINLFSQEVKTTIDKIANETCVYFNDNKEELSSLSSSERVAKLGLKMLSLYDKYKKELKAEGIFVDVTDDASAEAFGEKVGYSMAKYCTDVLISLSEDVSDDEDDEGEVEFTVEGELKNITGKELSILSLKDQKGKTQKFVWIKNFEGSDRLINDENVKGIKVRLTYSNLELYSPQLKEYIVRKQISKIEYLD